MTAQVTLECVSLSRISSYATRFILQLGLQLCPRFPAVLAQAAGTQALNLWCPRSLVPQTSAASVASAVPVAPWLNK